MTPKTVWAVYFSGTGTTERTVRSVAGEKYDRIVGYALGEKPSYREPGWDDAEENAAPVQAWEGVDDDSIPF